MFYERRDWKEEDNVLYILGEGGGGEGNEMCIHANVLHVLCCMKYVYKRTDMKNTLSCVQ